MKSDNTAAEMSSSLKLNATTPSWFDWALAQACESRTVQVDQCPIHYLRWPSPADAAPEHGLLFVHGGGAHANWWRFIAPFFVEHYRVAALDLSGMGDSGRREKYSAEIRAKEMLEVIEHAELGAKTFVIGHSFGGFMTIRFGVDYGDRIAGAVIADTPVRHPNDPPPGRGKRIFSHTRAYPDFEQAVSRFRLLPAQTCANDFIVEFIARHSLSETPEGWVWKFDARAMGADRWREPFHEHLTNMRCRTAYIHGQHSALVKPEHVTYIASLLNANAPIIEIPEAQHHLMLDQPLAFIATLRALLKTWQSESA